MACGCTRRTQGVGSARQLSRLVLEHDAYRWISGGVRVNHHSLSDFRVAHGTALDDLLSTSLAALMAAGAVKLERMAQDGVRVRTDAGAASFRRKGCLQDNLEQARARVRELKAQLQADPAQDSRHTTVAQQRARRQIQQRVQDALDRMSEQEVMRDPAHLLDILRTYRDVGLKTAIDDFGAGYSGLNLLADFTPDLLKLDMHLVRGIDQDRKRQAIARHGAALAQELGITVIAEGIETADESHALQDLGIDLQQGYLFARPQLDGLAPIHWPA